MPTGTCSSRKARENFGRTTSSDGDWSCAWLIRKGFRWRVPSRSSLVPSPVSLVGIACHPAWLFERGIRHFIWQREPSPLHLVDANVEAFLASNAHVNDAVMIRLQQVPSVIRYDV